MLLLPKSHLFCSCIGLNVKDALVLLLVDGRRAHDTESGWRIFLRSGENIDINMMKGVLEPTGRLCTRLMRSCGGVEENKTDGVHIMAFDALRISAHGAVKSSAHIVIYREELY